MPRVVILVDGCNLLKAADRLKRRVNLAELAFQRFYIDSNSGFGAAQRGERLAMLDNTNLFDGCHQ